MADNGSVSKSVPSAMMIFQSWIVYWLKKGIFTPSPLKMGIKSKSHTTWKRTERCVVGTNVTEQKKSHPRWHCGTHYKRSKQYQVSWRALNYASILKDYEAERVTRSWAHDSHGKETFSFCTTLYVTIYILRKYIQVSICKVMVPDLFLLVGPIKDWAYLWNGKDWP